MLTLTHPNTILQHQMRSKCRRLISRLCSSSFFNLST